MKGNRGEKLKLACLTVLGTGYLRPAPATWASAFVALLWCAVWWLLSQASPARWPIECFTVAGVALACWLSVRWGAWAEAHFGQLDPRPFVLDEFAGQWLALLDLPLIASGHPAALVWVVSGQFVLFRIMDIAKPMPARRIQSLPAGWGILMDDVVAGLYANVAGQLIWRVSPLAMWLGLT